MRQLVLDEQWLEKNVTYKIQPFYFRHILHITMHNYLLIEDCSEVDISDSISSLMCQNLRNKRLIFVHKETKEFLVYTIPVDRIDQFAKLLTPDYIWRRSTEFQIEVSKCSIRKIIGISVSKSLMDIYLHSKFNLSKVHKTNLQGLRDYTRDAISIKAVDIDFINRNTVLEASQIDDVITKEDLIELIFENCQDAGAFNISPEDERLVFVKYWLSRSDNNFSGVFHIRRKKFNSRDKRNVFDGIDIELNMSSSDYDENLKYVKENIKGIKKIIKTIFENHKISKDYANYMKMYSLVLTRDNILVAQFCFKDGLENLIANEEEE